jgi:hypothetical protein
MILVCMNLAILGRLDAWFLPGLQLVWQLLSFFLDDSGSFWLFSDGF